jgi:hypothetical protein
MAGSATRYLHRERFVDEELERADDQPATP